MKSTIRRILREEVSVPQPGESSGKPISQEEKSDMKCNTEYLNINEILDGRIKGIPYYMEVLEDVLKKDYSWEVTKKVMEYAKYMKSNPESLKNLPPIIVIDDKIQDGAHRISAIFLLDQYMDRDNPFWDDVKLKVEFCYKKNPHSSTLSVLTNQDQSERQKYSKFVQTKFKGDYEKGAKAYAKLKNRSADNVFGDKERLEKFMSLDFNFNSFSDKDWENYWLLSQHADLYPDFQKNALKTITKHLGKDNDYYKYLSDRISCNSKGTQNFGTQDICSKKEKSY